LILAHFEWPAMQTPLLVVGGRHSSRATQFNIATGVPQRWIYSLMLCC